MSKSVLIVQDYKPLVKRAMLCTINNMSQRSRGPNESSIKHSMTQI